MVDLSCHVDEKDFLYMGYAMEEARKALLEGEVPVGAILVGGEEILGCGSNRKENTKNPLAHAEMLAIHEASQKRKTWRLVDTTLYVTLEPCAMCAGAMVSARIKRVVYALKDLKSGSCGSVINIAHHPVFNHRLEITSGVREDESLKLMQQFFQMRRKRPKYRKTKSCTDGLAR